MSERKSQSPEFKAGAETNRTAASSPERPSGFENQSERLKAQSKAEKESRKELEKLHDEQNERSKPALELLEEDDSRVQTGRITKDDKVRAYHYALRQAQSRLSRTSRRFSQIIHTPAVERTSEVLEKSLARPSAMLGGAIFACIGLAVMTFFARRYGFALSGTELILFVSSGWLLGLIVELVWKKLIKRT